MVKSYPSSSSLGGGGSGGASSTGTFIGFGAFATPTTAHPSPSPSISSTTNDSNHTTGTGNASNYVWTPAYMGHDDTFRSLFVRIYQKREPITIVKALQELQTYVVDIYDKNTQNKKLLVEAMKHYAYLYYHKLSIGTFTTGTSNRTGTVTVTGSSSDSTGATGVKNTKNDAPTTSTVSTMMISTPAIRANAVKVWFLFFKYIPKAMMQVCYNHIEILGIIYATQTDPATEVRNIVLQLQPQLDEQEEHQNLLHPLVLKTSGLDNFVVDAKWQKCWDDGIIAFTTTRILSYSKPILLLEALCGHGNTSATGIIGQQHNQQRSIGKISFNDQQRDVLDELYTRLISNCLDCIGQWLQLQQQNQHQSDLSENIVITWDHFNIWFKPLLSYGSTSTSLSSSSKSIHQQPHTIRRKSYQLLTTITIHASYIYDLDMTLTPYSPTGAFNSNGAVQKILLHAFSIEKDPVNIPQLLETTLALLALYNRKKKSCRNEEINTKSLQVVLLKPLIKLFNKACFGAKVEVWGPMVLPLIGQYEELQEQYMLLSSIQAGIPFTYGMQEKHHVWIAICETSSFILLRSLNIALADAAAAEGSTEQISCAKTEAAKSIATLWLDGLQALLSALPNLPKQHSRTSHDSSCSEDAPLSSPTTFVINATEGQHRLLHNISDQLIQYHQAATEQKVCLLTCSPQVSDWFWSEGIATTMANTSHLSSLMLLLQELQARKERATCSKVGPAILKLFPILKARFHTTLQEQLASSSSVPSKEMYRYFLSVLTYCGPHEVFSLSSVQANIDKPNHISLEQFIMNDLLRWSIIHTSSLRTEQRHESSSLLVQLDFSLLATCLNGLNRETRKLVWTSFLREIILARCDVGLLSDGLSTLIRHQGHSIKELMPCDELDQYAKDVDMFSKCRDDDENCTDVHDGNDVSARTTKSLKFFRICLGTDDEADIVLISSQVVASWVDYLCIERNHSQIGFELTIAILESIRRQRNVVVGEQILSLLIASWYILEHPFVKSVFMEILNANPLLRNEFQLRAQHHIRYELQSYTSSKVSREIEKNWAERVWFLVELDETEKSSFPLLGFECMNTWKRNPSILFSLAMLLIHKIPNITDRLEFVKTWSGDPVEFVVELLTTISEAYCTVSEFSLDSKCKDRTDQSALFLYALGGYAMDSDFLDRLTLQCINKINNTLKEKSIEEHIQRRIAVLSLLIELKFQPVKIDFDELAPSEIVENDVVWYIPDPKNVQMVEVARVLKVHFDATTGFYFSILVNRDGEDVERQTVCERLRKPRCTDSATGETLILTDSIPHVNDEERKRLRNLIWSKDLIDNLQFVSDHNVGELVHVLVTQIGVGDDRGIGSLHYEVFRFVKMIDESISASIKDNIDETLKLIWTMSLTLGFGLNSPSSPYLLKQIWTGGPISSITTIIDYEEVNVGLNASLDAAVAAFFTIVADFIVRDCYHDDSLKVERFLVIFFRITSSLLCNSNTHDTMAIASEQIAHGIALVDTTTANTPTVEKELQAALHISIQTFSNERKEAVPAIQNIATSCIKRAELRHILSEVCTEKAQALCDCLFIPSKRNTAFIFLELVANRGKEFVDNKDVALTNDTALRLKKWTENLNIDDAAIIEDDVYIVAEWVPSRLMIEIERWYDSGYEMESEPTIVGRLLCWFCFLQFVESAAPRNFRNRPAFVSYLELCRAAYSILNLGLLHNEIINNNRQDILPTVNEVSIFLLNSLQPNITQLATLSLFRTVEVLPSLCRRWWEEDCPRVYTGPVQVLVEKFIAPKIFQREIERIESTNSFGKMSVSTSITKRDVTATYVQDDFTLKVVIVLPPAFPFRSAEVDCSKTLGVPQNRWKRWSLQITMMLNSQGGTLQDALMLWKDNVDKEFDGVEPCPVCYSVLHVKTHKLPCLQCRTCQNRFHIECLTEWFRSSGKSQCVLCQQPWQGTRV